MKSDFGKQLIDETPDAIIATTQQGAITYWNKRAESVFGNTSDEAEGHFLEELVIPLDRKDADRKLIQEAPTAEVVTRESIRPRKDSSLIYVDVSVKAVRDGVKKSE